MYMTLNSRASQGDSEGVGTNFFMGHRSQNWTATAKVPVSNRVMEGKVRADIKDCAEKKTYKTDPIQPHPTQHPHNMNSRKKGFKFC